MEPIVVAVLSSMIVYFLLIALIPKRILAEKTYYTRSMLKKLEEQQGMPMVDENASILREDERTPTFLTQAFYTLPLTRVAYPKILKSGLHASIDQFFIGCLIALVLLVFAMKGLGLVSIPLAVIMTYLLGWWYINRRIKKRTDAFLNLFPDALDMIVRSVRSGYPLNAAVRMLSENMQPPVSTEFKQVADETAYGSSLLEALQRLADRINESDIRFFVVVLAVQQEVGGNLAEVLSNLASIIRKRKHLRMKIRAMTSEGRATAWVLGMLPFFVATIIHFVAPEHLVPLFTTGLGNMILVGAVAVVALGMFIVRQMVNMEV